MHASRSFQNTALILYEPQPFQTILPGMEHAGFKVSDLVTDTDHPNEVLGKVVGFDKEGGVMLVKIKASKKQAELWGYFFSEAYPHWRCEDDKTYAFMWLPPEELVISAMGYSVSALADILYPHSHHSFLQPKELKFLSEEMQPVCWHKGCMEKSVGVGLINCWGSVYPVVMCQEHTRWHGTLCDSDPFTEREKLLAA